MSRFLSDALIGPILKCYWQGLVTGTVIVIIVPRDWFASNYRYGGKVSDDRLQSVYWLWLHQKKPRAVDSCSINTHPTIGTSPISIVAFALNRPIDSHWDAFRFGIGFCRVWFDLIWFDLILFSGADWLVRFRVDSARFTAPLPSDWLALFCNGLIIGAGGRGVCWMNWGKRPISSRQSSRHLMKLDETWWNLIWYQKWMKRIMAM